MYKPLCPQIFFQNQAIFRQNKGKPPYFEQILGSGPPWGQNSTAATPDQNPGYAAGFIKVFFFPVQSCRQCARSLPSYRTPRGPEQYARTQCATRYSSCVIRVTQAVAQSDARRVESGRTGFRAKVSYVVFSSQRHKNRHVFQDQITMKQNDKTSEKL